MTAEEIIKNIESSIVGKPIIKSNYQFGQLWLLFEQTGKNSSGQEVGKYELWFEGDWKYMHTNGNADGQFIEMDMEDDLLNGKTITKLTYKEGIVETVFNDSSKIILTISPSTNFEQLTYSMNNPIGFLESTGYNFEESGWYTRTVSF